MSEILIVRLSVECSEFKIAYLNYFEDGKRNVGNIKCVIKFSLDKPMQKK